MTPIDITLTCPVFDSFRVRQVAGMFDVPITERATRKFHVDVPPLDESWQVGLIVGPSGSGKTTIARRLFGDRLYRSRNWQADRAIVDGMGDHSIKTITGLLTAVGLGSPPSWLMPYQALSNGEQFRCDLARALISSGNPIDTDGSSLEAFNADATGPLVAFDEFTSVVDRNVARVASAAVARAVRRGTIGCRFVAVTCHYDVAQWLEPDWTLDMATVAWHGRRLRRPSIDLEVFRCERGAWRMFARHHYLSGSLSNAARCFLATWEGVPVAFCATVTLIGAKRRWRISRLVTLPDYQGIGIGTALAEGVAQLHRDQGHRMNITASHPGVIAHCRRSDRWRTVHVKKTGAASARRFIANYRGSGGRAVVSFEYVGG